GHGGQVSRSHGSLDRRSGGLGVWRTTVRSPAYFPKITMKVPLLLASSVSPGTASMLTVTREAAPSVTPLTGMSTLEVLPGSVLLITWEAYRVLPSVVTDTSTLTFVSAFEPAFSTITVNVGFAPPLTWLIVGELASVLVPTLTPFSECPCVPGAIAPLLEAGRPEILDCTVEGVSQPRLGRKRL